MRTDPSATPAEGSTFSANQERGRRVSGRSKVGAAVRLALGWAPRWLRDAFHLLSRRRAALEEMIAERTDRLQESERRYRELIDHMGEGVGIVDPDERFLFANPAAHSILQVPAGSLPGRSLSEFVDAEEMDRVRQQTARRRTGASDSYELRFRRADGRLRDMLVTASPRRDRQGAFLGAMAIFRDISERKQTEEVIRGQQHFQELLADIAADLVGLTGATVEGVLQSMLERIGEFFRIESAALVMLTGERPRLRCAQVWQKGPGTDRRSSEPPLELDSLPWLRRLVFEERTPAHAPSLEALPPEAHLERSLLASAGTRSALAVPLFTASRVLGFLALEARETAKAWSDVQIRGLTVIAQAIATALERLDTERALVALKEQAEAASRAKGAFLANVSHEIRTPLHAILGFAQLLERDASLGAKQREQARTIGRSGEHLLGLIQDILELSRVEANRLELHLAPLDLRQLLDDLEHLFRLRAEEKGLRFEVSRAAALPARIVADEARLRQILVNLTGNAIKFTSSGSVRVRVWSEAVSGEDRAVRLAGSVEDTGPGICADDQRQLFVPFQQLRAGQQAGGSGLGLSITRGLVELMGGRITVASEPGRGSTFAFEIPARLAPEVSGPELDGSRAAPAPASGLGGAEGPRPAAPRLTREDLAGLPHALRRAMLLAVESGDMPALRTRIEEVRPMQPPLAEGLQELARQHQYEALMELLQPEEGAPDDGRG